MIIEVKVPSPGESISEVQLADWLVEDGAYVEKDQEIAEIDSDKATLSISAEQSGTISLIAKKGDSIDVGSVVAKIDTDGKAPAGKHAEKPAEKAVEKPVEIKTDKSPAPAERKVEEIHAVSEQQIAEIKPHLSPLAKKLLESKQFTNRILLNSSGITVFQRKM